MSDSGNHTHVPGPSLWPIGFAVGVACLLLGLVLISWIVAGIGARARGRPRAPLGARRLARRARRGPGDRAGDARGRRRAGAPRPRRALRLAEPLPTYTRSRFLEASTHRRRRGDRRDRHAPGPRLHGPSLVHEPRGGRGRPRPARELPGGRVRHRELPREPERGRGQPAHGVRPQQRPHRGRRAELHDPLQPLRPPRLPGAAERADRRGGDRRTWTASSSGRCSRSRSAARATAACTTPRATGRPARPCARSTAYTFSIKNGSLVLGELYAVGNVSGTGANASISRVPVVDCRRTHVDGVEAWLYPIVPSQVTG